MWGLVLLAGCTRIPDGRTAVDALDIEGARQLDQDDLKDKLATAPTKKFFALFRGVVHEYELFDSHVLAWDLARIERFYYAKGFYDAHARAGRVIETAEHRVRVEIVVEEGKPTLLSDIKFEFATTKVESAASAADASTASDAVPITTMTERPADPELVKTLERVAKRVLVRGSTLEDEKLENAETEVKKWLDDHGYATAAVGVNAEVDAPNHSAVVTVQVNPGIAYSLGKITLEGLGSLPEKQLRQTLDLNEGVVFSRSELDRAQKAILDLGVVSSAHFQLVFPAAGDPHAGAKDRVAIRIKLEPTRLRTVRFGAGLELDALKTDIHGRARWEDRNFLGGLKKVSVEFTPGVVLYPTRIPGFQAPTKLLLTEKLKLELRIPSAFEARTTGFVRPEFNVYPVLVRTEYVPDAPVLGYAEVRTTQGLERTYFDKLHAVLSHSLQVEQPFSYFGNLDSSLSTLVISYVSLFLALDLRNDTIHPTRGLYFSNDLQVAGLFGNPRDIRIQPEARAYYTAARRVTFAARASLGFLIPLNYGSSTGTRDAQLTYFRGLFSGGPTQNRGYALRGIGPRGVVPFYDPAVDAQNAAKACTPTDPSENCKVPLGGLSLWEASLEARIKAAGALSVVAFCDASNVSGTAFSVDITRPHLSCGPGARYDTPIGPLRLDLGFRIPGAQAAGYVEPGPELISGLPLAVQVGLGEAF